MLILVRMNVCRSIAVALVLATAACSADRVGSADSTPFPQVDLSLTALVPMNCEQVDSFLRVRAMGEMNRIIDQQIIRLHSSNYLACSSYGGPYASGEDASSSVGTSGYTSGGTSGTSGQSSGSGGASAGSSAGGSSGSSVGNSSSSGGAALGGVTNSKGATQTSSTNNQIATVDEADFVKNDDKFIYAAVNGTFQIVQAYPANEAHEVARIQLEGEPRKLFVEGDRAVVYVAVPGTGVSGGNWASSWGGYYSSGGSSECTYGYDCVPSGDGTQTKILVFDIANRAAPVKIRELQSTGSLLAARRIGNTVHTVVVGELGALPPLKMYPDLEPQTCTTDAERNAARDNAIQAWEKLRQDNMAILTTANVRSALPGLSENAGPLTQSCDAVYRPTVEEGTTYTSVVSFDLTRATPPKSATIVGDPGVVYASESSLYMSVPRTRDEDSDAPWYRGMPENYASIVHEFAIGDRPEATAYLASGIVKGRVIDQFALDEYQGHLRIATTTGRVPSSTVYSTMNVLERRGNVLSLTGWVDHIAPHEDIRSVRFDGSRGFVVTFKKTDPLFAFDLSNPQAPVLTGEVQIPGFSTYMHMMDDTHLLTIGYDANDQGSFAWFAGVRLQIFDVSNMANPRLLHAEVIGTRGSSSEALTNHLAFNYYAPKNILALPMTICEGGKGGQYGTDLTFSGLMVYDVTVDGGFHLRGKVGHPNNADGNGYDSGTCSNWWTNASSEVKRSIVMDDFIYSISERRVKASSLLNLDVDLAEVSLENPNGSLDDQR